MRGGTSYRDSRAAGTHCRRAGPGRSSSKAKTPLLRQRAGVARCRSGAQTPLVPLQARAGCSGNPKSRFSELADDDKQHLGSAGRHVFLVPPISRNIG
jgi:hypothetical protein